MAGMTAMGHHLYLKLVCLNCFANLGLLYLIWNFQIPSHFVFL